jgi:hypothetical protein
MTRENPVLKSARVNLYGNDDPRRVRIFKAAQISTLPCIEKSRHSVGDDDFNLREEYSVEDTPKGKKASKTQRVAVSVVSPSSVVLPKQSKLSLAQVSTKEATLTLNSLPQIPSHKGGQNTSPKGTHSSKRKGVLGYADELFDMRMNAMDLKQKHRKEVETAKFEFQKGQVTSGKPSSDYTVSAEMIGALKDYLDRT